MEKILFYSILLVDAAAAAAAAAAAMLNMIVWLMHFSTI